MRYLALAAAAFFAALAAPASASAQEGEPVRAYIQLSIVTGDDDLRGGNDNVRGSYRIGETWSAPLILNRRGARWPDRSRNTARLDLPSNATIRNLNAVKLQTTFSGGMGGDNWNMDQLYVDVCFARGRESECIRVATHGPRRFTGNRGELIVPINLPRSDIDK
jgi:hypothetical protein